MSVTLPHLPICMLASTPTDVATQMKGPFTFRCILLRARTTCSYRVTKLTSTTFVWFYWLKCISVFICFFYTKIIRIEAVCSSVHVYRQQDFSSSSLNIHWYAKQKEKCAHGSNAIFGIIKVHYNIWQLGPPVNCDRNHCNCNGAHSCMTSKKVPSSQIYDSFHFPIRGWMRWHPNKVRGTS